jgi:hypothetical protein
MINSEFKTLLIQSMANIKLTRGLEDKLLQTKNVSIQLLVLILELRDEE